MILLNCSSAVHERLFIRCLARSQCCALDFSVRGQAARFKFDIFRHGPPICLKFSQMFPKHQRFKSITYVFAMGREGSIPTRASNLHPACGFYCRDSLPKFA